MEHGWSRGIELTPLDSNASSSKFSNQAKKSHPEGVSYHSPDIANEMSYPGLRPHEHPLCLEKTPSRLHSKDLRRLQ